MAKSQNTTNETSATSSETATQTVESTATATTETVAAAPDEKPATTDATPVATDEKATKTERIIKNHMLIAMGFGAVPIPMFDMAGITGTQLSMISKLAGQYNVSFNNELGKSVLMSLLGAVGSQTLATGTFGSAIKAIPFVGSVIGAVTYPAIAGATTYAVGNVFARHFEGGGTLLDFSASSMKSYFREELEKGNEVVKTVKNTVTKPFTRKAAK